MSITSEIGRQGEQLAAAFLRKAGFEIIATNWRFRKLEIDIIARKLSVLVFIEVKTRNSNNVYAPEASITRNKWDNIARAAGRFMEMSGHDWEIRFDIIAVIAHPNGVYCIKHYTDMYFPGRY